MKRTIAVCLYLLTFGSCSILQDEIAAIDEYSLVDIFNVDFSTDMSMDFSLDFSIEASMDFSFGESFEFTPSPLPISAPSISPSSYNFDTKTYFNYDFSIRIYNLSLEELVGSADIQEALRESVADVHRNVSFRDVSILNMTHHVADTRRHLLGAIVESMPVVTVFFRIRGVLERWGRFTWDQKDNFFSEMDTLLLAFLVDGLWQAALRRRLSERGIFQLFLLDITSFRRTPSSSIDGSPTTAPSPSPTPNQDNEKPDKDISSVGGMSFGMKEIIAGGVAVVLIVIIVASLVHCVRESKIKHVSVGVGT